MHELIACGRGELILLASVRNGQAIAEVITHIATDVVVVHITHLFLLHVIESIGIASLVAITKRSGIIQRPAVTHLPDNSCTTTSTLAPIDIAAIESVIEEAVGAVVIAANRVCELITRLVVEIQFCTQTVARAILQRTAHTLVVHRREGVDIHLTSHSVSTVECTLWTTQQLHAGNIRHIEIVVILVQIWYSINRHTNHGLVDTRTEATHID